MQNHFTYEITRSAIFCQHATLAILWATVFPLAVMNLNFESRVGVHNISLLALGEIHRSRSILFA